MDVRFDLRPIFKKINSVLYFEVKIVVVGIRTEPDFFQNGFLGFGLYLLLLLLLFVFELRIVDNLAHRRVGIWRYLHQIQALFFGELERVVNAVNARFDILTY